MAEEYKEQEVDNLPRPESEILKQVREEIRIAREYVQPKRIEFRKRLKLYNNQRKQRDLIADTSLYNVMNTMLAVYYTDERSVEFVGRRLGDTAIASQVENVAKFDNEEMEMDVMNYLTQWDKFFFGVGIREMVGWDEKRKVPLPKSLDAMSWLPDPLGYLMVKNFRFMGFEVEYLRSEMTEEAGFYNVSLLKAAPGSGGERKQDRDAKDEASNLQSGQFESVGDENRNDVLYCVDQFTTIKGVDGVVRKYIVTVDDEVKHVVRCEELKPVTEEEKADPSLVPYPIVLNYFSPTRNDPFGVSVGDLIEDKQRAKSILKNLRIASRKAALYPMYLYNKEKILNRRDLDFAFNKFIAVNGDVDGSVVPLNKVAVEQAGTMNDEQSLDRDISIATASDQNAQGVMSDQSRTLGEVQVVQANASLRFILGSRIDAWGEKRFWKLWYRLYKQNFGGEKLIRLRNIFGSTFVTLKRKDFITTEDPDIRIVSKLEVERKRAQDRTAFQTILPIINQDPSKPIVSKRYSERHMLRLFNLTEDQIAIMSPDTVEESRAKMENELLSKNEMRPIAMDEDHLSHIVVHAQSEDTDAKRSHIEAHKRAYYESGQMAQDRERQMAQSANMQDLASQSVNQTGQMNAAQNMPKPNEPSGVQPQANQPNPS